MIRIIKKLRNYWLNLLDRTGIFKQNTPEAAADELDFTGMNIDDCYANNVIIGSEDDKGPIKDEHLRNESGDPKIRTKARRAINWYIFKNPRQEQQVLFAVLCRAEPVLFREILVANPQLASKFASNRVEYITDSFERKSLTIAAPYSGHNLLMLLFATTSLWACHGHRKILTNIKTLLEFGADSTAVSRFPLPAAETKYHPACNSGLTAAHLFISETRSEIEVLDKHYYSDFKNHPYGVNPNHPRYPEHMRLRMQMQINFDQAYFQESPEILRALIRDWRDDDIFALYKFAQQHIAEHAVNHPNSHFFGSMMNSVFDPLITQILLRAMQVSSTVLNAPGRSLSFRPKVFKLLDKDGDRKIIRTVAAYLVEKAQTPLPLPLPQENKLSTRTSRMMPRS